MLVLDPKAFDMFFTRSSVQEERSTNNLRGFVDKIEARLAPGSVHLYGWVVYSGTWDLYKNHWLITFCAPNLKSCSAWPQPEQRKQ